MSALDVSIQSQVLNLLKDLQKIFELTYLFISHNLSVVKFMADRIAVMYLGVIVELADSGKIYENASHPYTKALLSAIPEAKTTQKKERIILNGDIPSPVDPPAGCRFCTQCPFAQDRRRTEAGACGNKAGSFCRLLPGREGAADMVKFIAKRLAISVVLLFIVTTLVFAFVHMMPGDPVLTMLGVDSNPDPVTVEKIRTELGLDQPILVQYGNYLKRNCKSWIWEILFREDSGGTGDCITFPEDAGAGLQCPWCLPVWRGFPWGLSARLEEGNFPI